MIKAYKYRLYPTDEQKSLLEKNFNAARFVYNWGLRKKRDKFKRYKNHGNKRKKTLDKNDLQKQLTYIKKIDEYKWLNEAGSLSLIFALRNLDLAYSQLIKVDVYKPRNVGVGVEPAFVPNKKRGCLEY